MAISLQKGQKIDLQKKDGSQLTNILVGLGWKEVQQKGGLMGLFKQKADVDIDASVIMLNANGKIPTKEEVIFFNHKDHPSGCVHHCGDNLVGGKMGGMDDSEQILVDLTRVPQNIDRIVFVVNIYNCVQRKQHFGMVENAYIRIVDKGAGETIASYNLTEDYSGKTSMVVGEIFMPINLTKGQKISLSKEAPNLKIALVGLGWDIKQYDSGADFDLDASIFLLDNTGKCAHDSDFIFYNNLSSGGVTHSGDNRTGEGEGDDEAVTIEFEKVPSYVEKIVVTVTIYEAQARGQNFGQVANAFVRLVDKQTGVELLRYDLGEDYSTETAIVFAEIYRHNGEWKFSAVGSGFNGGLEALCRQYGLSV